MENGIVESPQHLKFQNESIAPLNGFFRKNFNSVSVISKGGFGTVMRAFDILENKEVAVKKIIIDIDKDKSEEVKKIFREVQWLAKLDHKNVVRYYHSWIEEDADKENEESNFQNETEFDIDSEPNLIENSLDSHNLSTPEKIAAVSRSFSENSFWNDITDSTEISSGANVNQTYPMIQNFPFEMSESKMKMDEINYSKQLVKIKIPRKKTRVALFIKTQLYSSKTLADWLAFPERIISREENIVIFFQIIHGLEYIHRNQCIHRDIKPANILLSEDGNVKIGDFGLATALNYPPNSDKGRRFNLSDKHTSGLGTVTYAAPEQIDQHYYDEKVDIYSLGIIFFEMHCIFYSNHERHKQISQLKKELYLNENFKIKYVQQSSLILSMVSIDPKSRPSARDLCTEGIQNGFTHDLFPKSLQLFIRKAKLTESPQLQRKTKLAESPEDRIIEYVQSCSDSSSENVIDSLSCHSSNEIENIYSNENFPSSFKQSNIFSKQSTFNDISPSINRLNNENKLFSKNREFFDNRISNIRLNENVKLKQHSDPIVRFPLKRSLEFDKKFRSPFNKILNDKIYRQNFRESSKNAIDMSIENDTLIRTSNSSLARTLSLMKLDSQDSLNNNHINYSKKIDNQDVENIQEIRENEYLNSHLSTEQEVAAEHKLIRSKNNITSDHDYMSNEVDNKLPTFINENNLFSEYDNMFSERRSHKRQQLSSSHEEGDYNSKGSCSKCENKINRLLKMISELQQTISAQKEIILTLEQKNLELERERSQEKKELERIKKS